MTGIVLEQSVYLCMQLCMYVHMRMYIHFWTLNAFQVNAAPKTIQRI